jgi:hypothetical protein
MPVDPASEGGEEELEREEGRHLNLEVSRRPGAAAVVLWAPILPDRNLGYTGSHGWP